MFNQDSFTSTQNSGPKPQVIVGQTGSTPGGTFTVGTTVTEGSSAQTHFLFVADGTTTPAQLMDTATVNIRWDGASAADVGTLQYSVLTDPITNTWSTFTDFGTNSAGVVSSANGDFSFTDQGTLDPTVGTGVWGISVRLPVVVDNFVENGEHVKFKFTQNSATKFTNSFYVEAKVDIVDAVNAVNAGAGAFAGTAGQDVFALAATSVVFAAPGVKDDYAVISGFGAGDKLRVDIAPIGGATPNLSMVNFGDLNGVGINTEDLLINGLRALNGLDCNQGGLYMMGVGADTYIIFDSNNNGKLDTNGAANPGIPLDPVDDIFVKLVAVNPHSLQSTHFDLI
jgi:hypothetical protein